MPTCRVVMNLDALLSFQTGELLRRATIERQVLDHQARLAENLKSFLFTRHPRFPSPLILLAEPSPTDTLYQLVPRSQPSHIVLAWSS